MATLRCGAECWHRKETLGDHISLNYACRRERINHCWGFRMAFRRIIAFCILHFTDNVSTEGQLTGYILTAADGKRWNMGQVNG